MSSRLALLLTAVLGAFGCNRAPRADEDGGGAALMRNVLFADGVDVIVSGGAAEERCALIAGEARGPGDPRLFVRRTTGESPADHARVVVGTPAEPLAAHLARALGVELAGGGFRVLDQTFDLPGDVLIATWQDPDRPGLPVTLHLGNDLARLARVIEAPLWAWRPNLRVLRAGECVLEAPLTVDGRIVQERLARPAQVRGMLREQYTELPPDPAAFSGSRSPDVGDARARAYFLACAQSALRAAVWAAPGTAPEPGGLVLHAHLEEFTWWTGRVGVAWTNPATGVVHALLADGVADDGGGAFALATATRLLGPCTEPWLASGVAVHGAQRWHGRELGAWCGRLARAEALLTVETLLDPTSARRHSPHVIAPLRGELVGLLLEQRGDAYLRQLWSGTERLVAGADLERAFQARLAARAAQDSEAAPDPAHLRTARDLAGIVLSQPAFPEHRGYGTRACAASLAFAHDRGAEAVAITSTQVCEPDPPRRAGPGADLDYGPREGDAALLCAIAQARSTKASVALLPQLLSAPGGTWSGTWLRNSETEWRIFFASYRRFVQHYALLAELAGCDVLSLGGGLMETTRNTVEGRRGSEEELAWKSAGWSGVIRAARGAFHGRLTFLAGSADEAEKIGFWAELDLVGLEPRIGYRTLRGKEVSESRAGFMAVLQATWKAAERLARENQRPLFVGPVSFPATPLPGDARLGPGSAGDELQVEAFARVLQLARESRDVLDGVYFGRWSTELGDAGLGRRDHLLARERAFMVLQKTVAGGR